MITEQLKRATVIPQEIVDVVRQSVINTFESITGEPPVYVPDDDTAGPLNGIIGTIAVFNPDFTFTLMIALPQDTAIKLSEAFLGMELEIESEDMGDLIGELANILAGEVAANMETVGFRGQSSLPTATRGSDLRLFMPNKPPTSKLHFSSGIGEFELNMALSESK